MNIEQQEPERLDGLTGPWIELAARLSVLALLLYGSFVLVRPFLTVAVWGVVLCVALYPTYDRLVGFIGGRRRLAAAALTVVFLIVIIGPATWLALGLIDSPSAHLMSLA